MRESTRNGKKAPFTMVDKAVLMDESLSVYDKMVYCMRHRKQPAPAWRSTRPSITPTPGRPIPAEIPRACGHAARLRCRSVPHIRPSQKNEGREAAVYGDRRSRGVEYNKVKSRVLYRFSVKDNIQIENGLKVVGQFEQVNPVSEQLRETLLENGAPLADLKKFI